MRILLLLLLLAPSTLAGIHIDRPSPTQTIEHPPDLQPRLCITPTGADLFIPVQYTHAHTTPIVLLAGTNGAFRVAWGPIDAEQAAIEVAGTTWATRTADPTCGVPAPAPSTHGIPVRIMGVLETRVHGAYEATFSRTTVTVTTEASTESFPVGQRHHWVDGLGDWNLGPFLHEALLGAAVDPDTPTCAGDPLGCPASNKAMRAV